MDHNRLEAARILFEDHLHAPFSPNNVFFGIQRLLDRSLEEVAFDMLQAPDKVNTYLNWHNCMEVLLSVGVDISADSFFAFACPEEALEEYGEDDFEDFRPEDVKTLLEYFTMPKVGSYKLEEWL